VYAFDLDEIKEKVRPYVVKYLGADIANKYFGDQKPSINIKLPKIPIVEKDATSLRPFEKVEDPHKNAVPKDKAEKFNYLFLKELYKFTRMGKISQGDMKKWMNILSQGGTREGVYRALVLDNTYYSLEKRKYPVNGKIIIFAKWYLTKFVDKKTSDKKLQKINFFHLKRVVAEHSLEIIDAFKKRNDLLDWYGVLSGNIAQKYSGLFKGKIRNNPSIIDHRNWAAKVPLDYLKSEVILKVHKIFNFLRQD